MKSKITHKCNSCTTETQKNENNMTEQTTKTLGQVAYEALMAKAIELQLAIPNTCDAWKNLPPDQQAISQASADAVRIAVITNIDPKYFHDATRDTEEYIDGIPQSCFTPALAAKIAELDKLK